MVAVAAASSGAVAVEELVLDGWVEKSKGAKAGATTAALLASIASVWAKLLEVGVRGIANAPGMTREVRRGGQRAEEATRSAGVRQPGLEKTLGRRRSMKVEEERCWSSSRRKGRWVGSSFVTGIPSRKKGVSVREEVATGLGECFRGGDDAVQRGLLCNWAREC